MYDGFQNAALATPLGIPLIYGVDAVHGHNNVVRRDDLPAQHRPRRDPRPGAGAAASAGPPPRRSPAPGIDWDFAPCLCVARNDRWGRTYESFGEKPELAHVRWRPSSPACRARALSGPASVLATAKHYVGDGGTTGGVDQGNTQLTEAELRAIHLPPFQEAVAARRRLGDDLVQLAGTASKMHGHQYLITDVLKGELGFSGFVVSDWNGIDQIDGAGRLHRGRGAHRHQRRHRHGHGAQRLAELHHACCATEVQAGRVTMARIDDANRRILTKKFELGLFERPLTDRTLHARRWAAPRTGRSPARPCASRRCC